METLKREMVEKDQGDDKGIKQKGDRVAAESVADGEGKIANFKRQALADADFDHRVAKAAVESLSQRLDILDRDTERKDIYWTVPKALVSVKRLRKRVKRAGFSVVEFGDYAGPGDDWSLCWKVLRAPE